METQNCWEYMQCSRRDVCPAFPQYGRACFAVTGTWCQSKLQGSYEEKIEQCRQSCDWYKSLMGNESHDSEVYVSLRKTG